MCEMTDYIKNFIMTEKKVPAFGIEIKRHGESLYSGYFGFSDHERNIPLNKDHLFFMYSMTKPITVSAVMRLVEEGKLSLEDRVDKYLPAFSNVYLIKDGVKVKPNNPITVKHLFTMTAGLTYDMYTDAVNDLKKRTDNKASTQEVVNEFAKTPLIDHPGKRFNYSLCHDVLGAVAEVVTGKPFSDYLDEIVFRPLGMKNSRMFNSEGLADKIVTQYSCSGSDYVNVGKGNGFYITENYVSSGAGLISNATDYSIFADTLANGGISKNGYRLLNLKTIELLTSPQVGTNEDKGGFTCACGKDYFYGLGVRTRVRESEYSPIGEFGWDGAAGSYVCMDVKSGLSVTFTMNTLSWPSTLSCVHDGIRELAFKLYAK